MALLAALGLPLIGAVTTALAGVLLLPFGRGAELRDIVPRGLPVPLWTVAAGMAVMFVLFAWLYVRWSLAIPILTLEGKTLTEATRLSAQRIKGSFRRVGLAHLIHYVQMALLLALLTGLLRLAGRPLVAALFEREGGAGAFGVAALLITFYVLVWVLGVLGTARVVTLTVLHHLALGGTVSRVDLTATPEELRRARVRFSLLALASAAAFGVAAWLTVPRVEKELVRAGNPITVTAHRGASIEAPENTIAAVRGAIEAGADFAEIDVQQAGDGTIVVVHDANLKRLAGVDVNVWQAPYEALAKLDVGSHHSKAFAGERIPTLEQTLDFARDKIRLNIELKTNKNENERFIPDLVDLLRKKDWFERCIVTSLELHFLQQVRKLEPKVRIGIIITAKVGAGHDLDVDIYSVQPLIATSDFIRRAHADGREVHVWTVNERADMERFADRAADSLITDAPKLARQVLDARTPADGLRGAARRLFGLD
jgi:glycerophosphoryl diester phosphodiesterase